MDGEREQTREQKFVMCHQFSQPAEFSARDANLRPELFNVIVSVETTFPL